jgi:hypothetical protein
MALWRGLTPDRATNPQVRYSGATVPEFHRLPIESAPKVSSKDPGVNAQPSGGLGRTARVYRLTGVDYPNGRWSFREEGE